MRRRELLYVGVILLLALGVATALEAAGDGKDVRSTQSPAVQSAQQVIGHTGRSGGSLDSTGGPDAFGYRFVDNRQGDTATYNWIDIVTTGTQISFSGGGGNDDGYAAQALPFAFPFYGTNYSSVNICTNGFLEFTTTSTALSGTIPVLGLGQAIMPYLQDLRTAAAKPVMYQSFGTYVVFEWDTVNTYQSGTSRHTFECLLYNDGKIKLQYRYNTYSSGYYVTVGIQGAETGTNWLAYYNHVDNGQAIPLAGTAIWFFIPPATAHEYMTTAIVRPTTSIYLPSSSVSVIATFRNFGTTTESAPIKYSFNGGATVEQATSSLAQNASETDTFATGITLPADEGSYPLAVWTDLATDTYHGDDTMHMNVQVLNCLSALPWSENFDGVTGPAIPSCWAQQNASGSGTWVTSTLYPYSSPNAVYANTYSSTGRSNWLFSPYVSLTAGQTYSLSFYYREYVTGYTGDSLEVKFGMGNDSVSMTNPLVARFKPTSTTYAQRLMYFTPPTTGNYSVGFHTVSALGTGYGPLLDDVNVAIPPQHDYSVASVTSPSATVVYQPDAPVTVTAVAQNLGLTNEASAISYLFLDLQAGQTATEQTNSLAPTATENHSFGQQITMPAADGFYTLKVWTDLGTDANRANDTTTVQVHVVNCTRPLPWSENFDTGVTLPNLPDCWAQENQGASTWKTAVTDPNSVPNAVNDILLVLGVRSNWLFTPSFALIGGQSYLFHFYYREYLVGSLYYDSLEVKFGAAQDSSLMTSWVGNGTIGRSFFRANSTTYTLYSDTLTPATTGNYVIGIHQVKRTTTNYSYGIVLDDVGLNIGPGSGRCCYGDPRIPSCLDTTTARCAALGGICTVGLTCADNPCPIAPPNDSCAWVTPTTTFPATWTGNVTNATHDCSLLTTGTGEVWHAFTISQRSDVTLDFCNTNAAWNYFGTNLYTGCPCASVIPVSSSDLTTCTNGNATIHWSVLPAGTYYYPVFLYPSNNDTGAYSINLSVVPSAPPPVNDVCGGAIALSGSLTAMPWNNSLADAAGDNSYCPMYRDLWYCWSTECDMDVNVTTCGSPFDTKLAVFSADANCTCASVTGMVCNNDSNACGVGNSAVSFHATAGHYLIEVGSNAFGTVGAGVLNINTSVICTCDSATQTTVYMDTVATRRVWLHFNAPNTLGRYQVYQTTNHNAGSDVHNGLWVLAGTLIAAAPGSKTWSDTSAVTTYRNYLILHDCAPIGRCCYGSPDNPSCSVNSNAECITLEGTWTAGVTCTTPCPTSHPAE